MGILIGLAVILPVLYVWLSGWWFGRVIAFLAFVVIVLALTAADIYGAGPIVFFVGMPVAWGLSGLPVYWQRYKARSTSMSIALR